MRNKMIVKSKEALMYGGQVSAFCIIDNGKGRKQENRELQLRVEIGTRASEGCDCEWRRDWHGPVPVVAST